MGEESSGSPDRKRGGRSSGRESWNLGFSGCFPGAFSAPITCWCCSPSSTLPRRKQMEKGVSLPNHAVGFQGHSHRSENPSLLSRGNRRVIKWCVQSHSLQPAGTLVVALRTPPPALHRHFSPTSFSKRTRFTPPRSLSARLQPLLLPQGSRRIRDREVPRSNSPMSSRTIPQQQDLTDRETPSRTL